MSPIPDDPIVSSMERTGMPPWFHGDDGEYDDCDGDW